ncbi:MAG: carboxypeptidase-like regulatory domain-containing protein [candidate division WOR-3 bacterium]|nr:carboxypeptidase-like regulatory domain-containing protein [candidate division WOR-3 bacterium]
MKRFEILILLVIMVACLKPPRDNRFDPENPDKAYLVGRVMSPDSAISDAEVKLLTLGDETYKATRTNSEGWYEFKEIDPGVYKIVAFTDYYLPAEYSPESLPAGASDTVDLYFSTLKLTFDEEPVGTTEPFGFKRIYGDWQVVSDTTAPSQPNVYNCNDQKGFVLFNKSISDFFTSTSFKFLSTVDTLSRTGFILRMKDTLNYYTATVNKKGIGFVKFKNGFPYILDFVTVPVIPDQWYELGVEASGNVFKIYFNGELKIEKNDPDFNEGKLGLILHRETPPKFSVNFDDVIIQR